MDSLSNAAHHKGPAAKRYEELSQDRAPYLERARQCAKLTIPYLIPPDHLASGQTLPLPYQSVGASGVTNLASKLLITMLPPNEPCFRLRIDNVTLEEHGENVDRDFRAKVERALSRVEQAVLGDIESTGDRPVVYEGNLHLLVGGNVLFHDDPKAGLRLFPLTRFVVERDPQGTPVEIIVQETVNPNVLPPDIAAAARKASPRTEHEVTLYTRLIREGDTWNVHQECQGETIAGTTGTYKISACPWIPVRMYAVAGENYGRSYVELQQADLATLESLSKAIIEGAAASAKVLFFVQPNAVTSATAVAEAPNGAILEGRADDVTVLQVRKQGDLQLAASQAEAIITRLKANFVMLDAVRRQADRVTAEEIRAVAQELENALGGVYTVISQEFQLPYIASRMARMTREKRLPPLPRGLVRPSVVTGFEALGRGNDRAKLVDFLNAGQQLLGMHVFEHINPANALTRLASSMGIPTEGLVKDDSQRLSEQHMLSQTMEQQQLFDLLKPVIVRVLGDPATREELMQSLKNM